MTGGVIRGGVTVFLRSFAARERSRYKAGIDLGIVIRVFSGESALFESRLFACIF